MWSTALDTMFIESAFAGFQLHMEPTHTVYINSPQDIFYHLAGHCRAGAIIAT